MSDSQDSAFLDLLSRSFGTLPRDEVYREFRDRLEEVTSESEFDLFLWSLAHRFKVDTEELLRQLGERWFMEVFERGLFAGIDTSDMLGFLDGFVSDCDVLEEVPIPGFNSFRIMVVARKADSLRVNCVGARRCCSFLEGVARGMGDYVGVSVRYLRQPKKAQLVDITFSCFAK